MGAMTGHPNQIRLDPNTDFISFKLVYREKEYVDQVMDDATVVRAELVSLP
jgi:hypothetical protein